MRQLRMLLWTSLVAVTGAGLGVLAGLPFGRRATLLGATALGTLAVLGALQLAARFGWFDPARRRGGAIGGLVGLGLGAPLALMSLDNVLLVTAGALLVGIGTLVGAGRGATIR